MRKRPFIISLGAAAGMLLLLVGVRVAGKSDWRKKPESLPSVLSPSPFPFQELTIPYLRKKNYTSNLGERVQVDITTTHTAYLTNYVSDGLKINGLLTIPQGEMPAEGWPAVVFIHGYVPPTQYRTQEKYAEYVDYLAENGLVVFKIDLRGHGDSEGEPAGAYFSSDYVVDILNARAALAQTDFVNDNRVGLWGHSMAGNLLLRSLAVKPDIPAVVIWAGAGFTYADIQAYGIQDSSFRSDDVTSRWRQKRQEIINVYGPFDPNHEFWKQVVATNFLSEATGALQLHHAVDDEVVSVEYSRNLDRILDSTQISHEFYEHEGGGHNISGVNFGKAMGLTVDFYKKYLVIK